MMITLDELGHKYGTDKASGSHDYLRWYTTFFEHMRYKAITFVEIGIASGASIKTWRDYFPNALIVGMDIQSDEEKLKLSEDRVRLSFGDQSSQTALDDMLMWCGGAPDVVNDDAGHQPDAQLFSYQYLVPQLAPNGLYILEDIGGENVTRFLMQLAFRVVHGNAHEDNDPWIKEHGGKIDTVNFYRESVITKLKG